MTRKNKVLLISIAILIAIIGISLAKFTIFSEKQEKIPTHYSLAIESSLESSFTPFLDKFKTHIGEETITINLFSTEEELQTLLKNAKKNKLLAVLTPIKNDSANLENLHKKDYLSNLPEKNIDTNTFAALQKTLTFDKELKVLAIAYNPYIMLAHKEQITKEIAISLHIAGNTDDLKLANAAYAKNVLESENIIETLTLAQNTEAIQKNPESYSLIDIYTIFNARLTHNIIVPFSFVFDIPTLELREFSLKPMSPFLGTLQGVLFPAYVKHNFKNDESIYTKAYDFFANPDFQYNFANVQNFLPARIDSLQRNAYSDAMRTFLLNEGTFINTETQYASENEKKELLSTMKEALSTTKQ